MKTEVDEAQNSGVPSAEMKPTSGPWFWKVDLNSRQVSLQSEGKTRMIVMDCIRWGNGGVPRFHKGGLMERADSFAAIVEGREHHASWFQSLNHPDAHLIAAAPDLYEIVTAIGDKCTNTYAGQRCPFGFKDSKMWCLPCRAAAAILKAEGR